MFGADTAAFLSALPLGQPSEVMVQFLATFGTEPMTPPLQLIDDDELVSFSHLQQRPVSPSPRRGRAASRPLSPFSKLRTRSHSRFGSVDLAFENNKGVSADFSRDSSLHRSNAVHRPKTPVPPEPAQWRDCNHALTRHLLPLRSDFEFFIRLKSAQFSKVSDNSPSFWYEPLASAPGLYNLDRGIVYQHDGDEDYVPVFRLAETPLNSSLVDGPELFWWLDPSPPAPKPSRGRARGAAKK